MDESWYWKIGAKCENENEGVKVTVDKYGRFRELERDWQDKELFEGWSYHDFDDGYWGWLRDTPTNPDLWLVGNLTAYPGSQVPGSPPGLMVMNNIKKLYHDYEDHSCASRDLGISKVDLDRLVKKHKGEPFTLNISQLSELKKARYYAMYTEIKTAGTYD